nr:reverse transcriptase domain-containing protein [Tanacetum cinerariifolium]
MTYPLEKNAPFVFFDDCVQAFRTLKEKLTEAPILIAPDWDQPFELMCDASDFVVEAVLGYLANPGKNHWEAVKWILKYLKGTADVGLVYGRDQGKHVDVDGFVDSDYAKDPDKEEEYMALIEAIKEII